MHIPAFHTLISHLDELRTRLFVCIGVLGATTIISLTGADYVLLWLTAPLRAMHYEAYFFGPAEAFIIKMKVAFFVGLIVSFPVIFVQGWLFVSPGLYPHEKKYVIPVTVCSSGLFVCGVWFSYYWVVPFALQFLLSFRNETLVPLISISEYISFIMHMLVSFGLIFILPICAAVLTRAGLITHTMLYRIRSYAIVAIFIIAAFVTPPDVVSQLLMAGPLLLLYELSALVSWFMRRK